MAESRTKKHPRERHPPPFPSGHILRPAPSPPLGVPRHVPCCRIKVEPPTEMCPAGHVDNPEGGRATC